MTIAQTGPKRTATSSTPAPGPSKSQLRRIRSHELLGALAQLNGLPITPGRWSPEAVATMADTAGATAAQLVPAISAAGALALTAAIDGRSRDAHDLAAAARELAVTAGILVDKAQLLTGQATSRHETVDLDATLRRLAVIGRQLAPIDASSSTTAALPASTQQEGNELDPSPL